MMRVIYMGTPHFAVPTLMEIAGQGHDIAAVYTQPPRPAGRGMDERKSPVHEAAEVLGLDVRHPSTLKDRADEIAALEADVTVVAAYGLILPPAVIDATHHGAYNVHASLLPRWRGAAPVARAVMAGDTETGVTIMKMDEGLDTGAIAMIERTAISAEDTAGTVTERLARLGADLMVRALGGLERGALDPTPQPETGVTYAHKIEKAEARIDFTRPASAVRNHIHGLNPVPGAWTLLRIGDRDERIKVLRAVVTDAEGTQVPGTILDRSLSVACGDGALRLIELQRAGKGVADADAFLRGARVGPGARFEAG